MYTRMCIFLIKNIKHIFIEKEKNILYIRITHNFLTILVPDYQICA